MQPSAAIILCGGASSRMGTPKAWLQVSGRPLLLHMLEPVLKVASPIIVVAAEDQMLPELPQSVVVVRDQHPARGPLEGFAAGLRALPNSSNATYLLACDLPNLSVDFLIELQTRLSICPDTTDAIVPTESGQPHPLSAIYRTRVRSVVEANLAGDRLAMKQLLRELMIESWPISERESGVLKNLNTPDDYAAFNTSGERD